MSDAALRHRRTARRAPDAPCITSASRPRMSSCSHMLRERHSPDIPVLFLDTVHHFAETLRVPRRAGGALGAEPGQPARRRAVARAVADEHATRAARRHKVEPLFSALERYDVWFTGLRREQSPAARNLAQLEPFRLPSGRMIRKVSPLATWTTREVWTYASEHAIPLLPLYEPATRASAASRARRCRSIPPTRARAAGRARSSNAGFTSSR